ncbi:ABC transporter ATP-binding protein [Actibacterium sp. XHP0104]|uniref:ABC transporter ATP-binding protein n=1 Tax=Actibacterium sp. XHP0104 TaxID=2984335 RepID=UPI0021E8D528|nr:ABC transporter ATP-binding protein [Actibacterium sp. XHP0104]MCV2881834.1 ABC transporter ATP-binding protein/permease [Actibacterium sp. XHP0104]
MFYVVMGVMVIVTFSEIFGLSTLLLLLRVLSKPEIIETNRMLHWLHETFTFNSDFAFQVFLAVLTLLVVFISLTFRALGNYAIIRYSTMRGYTLSSRLLQAYLHQPYEWFLERNSAEVNKSILGEVQGLVARIIIPLVRLVGSLMMAAAIIVFLVVLDPLVAVFAAASLGGSYALIYLWLRKRLERLGKESLHANKQRFQLMQEATGGVKEVKLLGLEESYVRRFREPARLVARNAALSQVYSQLPRIALEALTFAILLGIVMTMLLRNGGDIAATIPTLGIFAFAVMRLLPTLQQVYASVSTIRNGAPVLDHIYDDYTDAMEQAKEHPVVDRTGNKLPLKDKLELRDLSFSYGDNARAAVEGINLIIPARSTIGVVGGTGAGKTTLIDLMLGLLTPQGGEIVVDGQPLTRENMHSWRRTLGYVPQTIYLTDSTVAQNIAFGVPADKVDMEAVERASRIAALHDFVTSELPQGYDTIVGERGVRLSGGQRQRIGIARALYHDPLLIIMDEATSALDNLTEREVMEAVQNVRNQKTIIMIAHRLSTVRNCDQIILLERGRIVSQGTFDELVEGNETFRKMASNG